MTNVYMHLDLFCAIEYFCSLLRKDEGIRSWEITGGMSWNMACNRWWHDTNHDAGSDIKKSTHRLRLVYLLLCLLLMLLWICMHNARDPLTRNPLPDSTYHLADLKSVTTESQNVSPCRDVYYISRTSTTGLSSGTCSWSCRDSAMAIHKCSGACVSTGVLPKLPPDNGLNYIFAYID